MIKFSLIIFALILAGCQKQTTSETPVQVPTAATASPAPAEFREIAAETVLNKFKAEKLPIEGEVVYTEETDKNDLLGRPGQYVEKINFSDKRTKGKAAPIGNTIEVFKSAEDLEKRKTYTETISKSGGFLLQYIYAHKNVLLRLDHQLLPKDAAQYEKILKSL